MIKKGSVYKAVPINEIYSKPAIDDPKFEKDGYKHIEIVYDIIVLDFFQETFENVNNFWIKILYGQNKVGWLSLSQQEFNHFKAREIA